MDTEKKLDTIEEEMKLLKGELKQSLTSVRDYLLNMELPSSEFSTILAALGSEGNSPQQITIEGNLASTTGKETEQLTDGMEEVTEVEVPEPEDDLSMEPNDILSPNTNDILSPDANDILNPDALPENDIEQPGDSGFETDMLEPEEADEPEEPEYDDTNNELDDLGETEDHEEMYKPAARQAKPSLEEDPLMGYEKSTTEPQSLTPKVNLLANLINWVARAKQEIGYEQLSTFLEVYGVSGHLSPELKEAILQLCEITAEQSDDTSRADVWSQSMLSLHGILTGGDAPLFPFKSNVFGSENEDTVAEDEIIEVDKPKEQPVKLKLVFPNGNGESKEFCVDLAPAMDSDDS